MSAILYCFTINHVNIKKKAVLLVCLILMVVGCGDSSDENEEQASVEQLDGNTFSFVVEREIEEIVTEGFTIDDSLYVEVENGDEDTVSFSGDHENVSINSVDLSGSLEAEENGILEYNIDDGFFSGGRFVVWAEDSFFMRS